MSPASRRTRDPRQHLLWPVLEGASRDRGAEVALVGGTRGATHAELAKCLATGAARIDDRFAPGSRLLVAAYDQMVVAVAFLAALRSRCIPLLVDPQPAPGLAQVARRWGVAGALGDAALLSRVPGAIDQHEILSWLATPEAVREIEPPAVRADDPAFWTFTSGTTGEPRAVVHAHRGPLAAHRAFGRDHLGLGPRDRTISTAGLPFVYALGNALLFPLLAGGSALLPADLLLPTVLGEMRRHGATVLVSGPWSLEAMARLAGGGPRGDALRGLRLVLSAGEPLSESVFERWREACGGTPIDNLGCTEMFNSFLSSPPEDARPGSLGRPVAGFEVRVEGRTPTPGARGALEVRGDSRAIGLSDEDDRIVAPSGDWCETGDEVEVDAEGRFVFLGRLDDRFKVRGQFVRPAEVERRLAQAPGVRECLVGPELDENGLACVAVRVSLERDVEPAEVLRQLRALGREVLPAAARSMRLYVVETLPRTARGKILRERRAVVSL